MAGFSITPDIPVAVTQGVLFLANLFAVKRLVVDPYQRLALARTKLTSGSEDQTRGLVQENERLDQEITERLQKTRSEIARLCDAVRAEAQSQYEGLLKAAEAETSSSLGRLRDELRATLAAEEKNAQGQVNVLADLVFEKLTADGAS